ncbi:hypothetical protein KSP40_PGU002134 [Platanthera guangdongensis]|uniref:Transcription repressor n=1 Tax=Platanthera guangdongensis TaxID=2320717 RepID=A0ABR2LVD7_9ASPA
MVPNAWFYKLKDMSRARKGQNRAQHQRTNQKTLQIQQNSSSKNEALLPSRASYYFSNRAEAERPHGSPLHPRASDTLFPQDSPKKMKRNSGRKPIDAIRSIKISASASELPALKLELPPITTKPAKKETGDAENHQRRRSPTGIHRLRMRASSPRMVATATKVQAARKSVSKRLTRTFAVVKSSTDPQKDFRESMVEMISENNIRSSKDLEELLACYLLLNENEYHDVIVKVFEQIWVDLTDIIV